jgi:iron complex transport system substrate-binding protein
MSHKNVSLFAFIALAILIPACGPIFVPAAPPTVIPTLAATPTIAPQSTAAPTPIAVTDVTGRKVTLVAYPQRIISLAPSNTEILFTLDLASKIVAVDEFSDYPAEAKSLGKIGGSNGKYNFEQIVALKPDLISPLKSRQWRQSRNSKS